MVLLRDLLERIIDPLWGSYCEIFTTLADIDKLQRTKIDDAVYVRRKEHFMPFLVFGVLAVLAAIAITPHTRKRLI